MILPVPVGFNSGAISMVLTGLGRGLTQDSAGFDPKRVSPVRSGRIFPLRTDSRSSTPTMRSCTARSAACRSRRSASLRRASMPAAFDAITATLTDVSGTIPTALDFENRHDRPSAPASCSRGDHCLVAHRRCCRRVGDRAGGRG